MLDALAHYAYLLVSALAELTHHSFGTASAAAAIVLTTVLIRLVLLPVALAQHRADAHRAEVLGRLAGAGKDQAQKVMSTEGAGLLRGCLPMLVQLPVFAGLYRLAVSPTIQGETNTLLQHTLFGAPLGAHLTALGGEQLVVFAALLALLALIGYGSSRLLRPAGPSPAGAAAVVTRVVSYLSVATALFFPVAAALYLVTTTAWTLGQTVFLRSL